MATLTREQIIQLYNGLHNVGSLPGVKFGYAVAKNKNILKSEIEALEGALKPTEQFLEYEEKRIALAGSHAEKDEGGNPKTHNNMFVLKSQKKFDVEHEKLKDDYKDAVEGRTAQIEEYNTLLKSPMEIVLHTLKLEEVPAEIKEEQIAGIFHILEE